MRFPADVTGCGGEIFNWMNRGETIFRLPLVSRPGEPFLYSVFMPFNTLPIVSNINWNEEMRLGGGRKQRWFYSVVTGRMVKIVVAEFAGGIFNPREL